MFTDKELQCIESMANEKLIAVNEPVNRLSRASFSFMCQLDNKDLLESILKKVRQM